MLGEQVSEVQTISAQLLELLAVGSAAHHFPEKVCLSPTVDSYASLQSNVK